MQFEWSNNTIVRHAGSCLCGQVNFEVEGDFDHFFLCHCKYCRKDTGSAHAANLFSASAKLHWLSGEDKVMTFKLPATRHVHSFCSHCGSAMPNVQMDGALLVVPAGCLDADIPVEPDGHIFMANKANWDDGLELAAKFDEFPDTPD